MKRFTLILFFLATLLNAQGINSQAVLSLRNTFGFNGSGNIALDNPFGFIPPGYDADAQAIFDNSDGTFTSARKSLINTVVIMFKDSLGVSSIANLGFDYMYFMAQNDSVNSKIDWINPTHNLTTVNLLIFTADRGWIRSAAGSYINTGYDISAGTYFTQTQGSYFFYSRTDVNETSIDMGVRRASPLFESRLSFRISNNAYFLVNTGTSFLTANTNSQGLETGVRISTDSIYTYKNGVMLTRVANTSIALISANDFICGANNGAGALAFGCTRECAFASRGGYFTAVQVRMINNIVEYYMDQVGAGVEP